jgi:hypothetical protein
MRRLRVCPSGRNGQLFYRNAIRTSASRQVGSVPLLAHELMYRAHGHVPDQSRNDVQAVWLRYEYGVAGEFFRLEPMSARSDDDGYVHVARRNHPCEIETAQAARHVDVRDDGVDLPLSEDGHGFKDVGSLDHIVALVEKGVGEHHPDQDFIFDDENRRLVHGSLRSVVTRGTRVSTFRLPLEAEYLPTCLIKCERLGRRERGFLLLQSWRIAARPEAGASLLTLQPVANVNLADGWYLRSFDVRDPN